MRKTFTKEYIRDNLDCYLRGNKRFIPVIENSLSKLSDDVTLKDVLTSAIRLQDKFWWLLVRSDITVEELKDVSSRIADISLIIYEQENPGDDRLRKAFELIAEGENPVPGLKEMISELNDPAAVTTNALKSVTRAATTLTTKGHKRPVTIMAVYRALRAAEGNAEYLAMFDNLLSKHYE